ncbi:VOC family protein [Mycolicibacterium confluentis]|uniref:Glyoxalase n=1 Tax=Mycolicibacterium confluentis TaxID=28047 RepID=A0A7I7Y5S7_9MYCO|nr:VOC family protein [Mycolicibacterium confluentis]MCV7318340.1 VOC family protein [Mycolicibacterium confluentis]ORV29831.1 glyoxalase [Mycolicibacterium confluentis]BBZ36251.1 glyoxalase [Mycolicibacterium confluentis]
MSSSPLPGPVRQIGYVVGDLDAALASWVELGVGPWFVLRRIVQQADHRGERCEVTISIALANSGELQLELIEQHGDTPSIYTEFLDGNGPGFHQLAYWPEDFDATLRAVRDAGWPVVWSSAEEGGVRYAYVEPPAGVATVVELMEYNDVTQGLAKFVRDAADGWDGSDPIRPLN